MPVTATELLKHLEVSGLLEGETLSAAREEASRSKLDGRALAAHLVQKQKLTAYQAKQILAGNTRGFFLEKYKILEPIGRGGMGLVFKAEHTMLGRVAAIKVLPRKSAADRESVARFRREACATAQLEHENIVRVYDVGQQGKAHFIAMEFVPGESLSKTIKGRGRLPVREAVSIIYQVVQGLEHAFNRGITHRDLKPSNILVTPEGKAKILDMGLARAFGLTAEENAGQLSLTMSGTVVGTVDYVAPEQADDSHSADVRSDIYSLGCTLYECLTGRVPFPGGTMMQKLMKHYRAEPTAIAELAPDVPEGLVATVKRMMAKRPADRFQSPGEVAQALHPILVQTSSEQPAEPNVVIPFTLHQPVSAQSDVPSAEASHATLSRIDTAAQVSRPTLPTIPLGTRGPLGKPVPGEPVRSEAAPEAAPVAAETSEAALANNDTHKSHVLAPPKPNELRAPTTHQQQPPTPNILKPSKPEVARATAPTPPATKPKSNGAQANAEPDLSEVFEAIAAAANESLPSAVVVPWPRNPPNRTRTIWIACAIAGAIVAAAVWYWITPRTGVLVLQFPETYSSELNSQGVRGRVLVDGRPMPVPDQITAEIPIRAGRHNLVVELPGLVPVNKLVSISPGTRLLVDLTATAQKLRQWELKDLEARVVAAASDNPNDAESLRLRQELTAFVIEHRGTEEVRNASELRSRLPWPADRLPVVKTLEDLISTSSEPNSPPSQIAVVAVLGTDPAADKSDTECLSVSPDGRFLARGRTSGKVELLAFAEEPSFRTLGDHGSPVMLTAFTADGRTLVSVSKDKIKLWNTDTRSQKSEIAGLKGQVDCAAQSLDGRTLACAFREGRIAIYDVGMGQEKKQLKGFATPVLSLALAPDGDLLALGSKDKVEIWNVRSAQRVGTLGASQEVVALSFSPDNQLLSKVGRAGAANVWKVGTWQRNVALQKDRDSLAFGPDGRIVAVVTNGRKVEFITTQSGEVRRTLEFKETLGPVRHLVFTPDGRHIASAHSGGVICLVRLIPMSDSTQKKAEFQLKLHVPPHRLVWSKTSVRNF